MLTVSRKVIELNREFHPDGRRFLVRHYPKDKEYRRLKLSPQIAAKLKVHIKAGRLGPDGLLFARRASAPVPLRVVAEPGTVGFTEPNEAGRRYLHGTLSAYNAGLCRCPNCRGAFADYRAQRRAAAGASSRRPRAADEDEHIGRNWFRRMVWHPACEAAGLPAMPRFHDLRHSHASWLQMSDVASDAKFGGSRERVLPAVQRAALGRARSHRSPCTLRDLGCHRPLALSRTMMQPVRLQQMPA
jgi:integrase